MNVEIYKPKKSLSSTMSVRIIIQEGSNIDDLPDEIKNNAGGFDLEKKIEISSGEQRIALNADEAIADIKKNGYYIQSYQIKTNIIEGGKDK